MNTRCLNMALGRVAGHNTSEMIRHVDTSQDISHSQNFGADDTQTQDVGASSKSIQKGGALLKGQGNGFNSAMGGVSVLEGAATSVGTAAGEDALLMHVTSQQAAGQGGDYS